MNIIGLMTPKIVSLLTIWIPSYSITPKLVLTAVWFVKLVIDHDAARPGHSGNIYKLTKKLSFEVGEIVVACVRFIPSLVFIIVSLATKTWIPAVPGAIATILCLVQIILEIKDAIVAKQKR